MKKKFYKYKRLLKKRRESYYARVKYRVRDIYHTIKDDVKCFSSFLLMLLTKWIRRNL